MTLSWWPCHKIVSVTFYIYILHLHIPKYCPFWLQPKQFLVILYTLYSSLPVPVPKHITLLPAYFCKTTPNHPHSYTQDVQTISIFHVLPHQPHTEFSEHLTILSMYQIMDYFNSCYVQPFLTSVFSLWIILIRAAVCDSFLTLVKWGADERNKQLPTDVFLICRDSFRRMLKEQLHKKFICSNDEQCNIDSANRTTCKCCRFAKCLQVGMTLEGDHWTTKIIWMLHDLRNVFCYS